MPTAIVLAAAALAADACGSDAAPSATEGDDGGSDATAEVGADPFAPQDDAGADAPVTDSPPSHVGLGAITELPLRVSPDPSLPFNHSAETTIAARDGHVVVAYINLHMDSATTFTAANLLRGVAVAVSHDSGGTFAVQDPGTFPDAGAGDQTSDPVVRVGVDGTFWLSTLNVSASFNFSGSVAASTSHGDAWQVRASGLQVVDKEWLAIDDSSAAVFLGAVGGTWKLALDGSVLGSTSPGALTFNGYTDDAGAHFAESLPPFTTSQVSVWNGTGTPTREGAVLAHGDAATVATIACQSVGASLDGAQWELRAVRDGTSAGVVLRVRRPPLDEGVDVPLTPAAFAFDAAGALDAEGRLHVVWYESQGPIGMLKYARSVSSDLRQGLGPSLVVDAEACPGGKWYPDSLSMDGGRRLREYVDVAVDGRRAHLTWTHAPVAPSRVRTAYVDF